MKPQTLITTIFFLLLLSCFASAQDAPTQDATATVPDTSTMSAPPIEVGVERNPPPASASPSVGPASRSFDLLPYAVLLAAMIVLAFLFGLIRLEKIPGPQAVPSFLLTIAIFGALFLMVSDLEGDHLGLPMGLLGVVVGYALSSIKN